MRKKTFCDVITNRSEIEDAGEIDGRMKENDRTSGWMRTTEQVDERERQNKWMNENDRTSGWKRTTEQVDEWERQNKWITTRKKNGKSADEIGNWREEDDDVDGRGRVVRCWGKVRVRIDAGSEAPRLIAGCWCCWCSNVLLSPLCCCSERRSPRCVVDVVGDSWAVRDVQTFLGMNWLYGGRWV